MWFVQNKQIQKPNNMAAKSTKEQERVFAYFKNAIDIAYEINANQVVVTSGWAYLLENKDETKTKKCKNVESFGSIWSI